MADGETRVDDPKYQRQRASEPLEAIEDAVPSLAKPDTDPGVVLSANPLATGIDDDPGGSSRPVLADGGGAKRLGDRVFGGLTSGASGFVILLVLLVAAFLIIQAVPSIADDKSNFLFSDSWDTTPGALHFGVAGLIYTTVLISLIALLIAVPLAIGIALFITQYAPKRVASPVANIIDLLAAIPSIIYGIWGIRVLAPHLEGFQNALSHIGLGLFSDQGIARGTVLDGGIVLAVMILPIITAISRDVYARTPNANKEAALALGATRWEMIRLSVLPYGRPGVVSGSMLGLGRALGETVAVYLILSSTSSFSPSILAGGQTIASKIALGQAEFGKDPGPYIAAGLMLFLLTFVVNAAARAIVSRGSIDKRGNRTVGPIGRLATERNKTVAAAVVGLVLLVLAFTATNWFSTGRFSSHFSDVHSALGSTDKTYGMANAYFGWLGWLLLVLALAATAVRAIDAKGGQIRLLGYVVAIGGAGLTYWAARLGSGIDSIDHVSWGFWLAFLGFLITGFAVVSGARSDESAGSPGLLGRKPANAVATALVGLSFLIALIPLVWLLYTVISKGLGTVLHVDWWTTSQRNINYTDPGGGALHAIVGTLEQVALCAVIAVPVGILVGVYLVEYGRGPLARAATFMVDILTGIPSIVAALFIYAVFVTAFGLNGAAWLVSLALVMLMLPVVVRSTEEMLKLVPNELREASYALGVPKWKTILKIVVPTAFSGLITGVILGIARVAGETAPLLILLGYSPSFNFNPLSGPQGTLPGMILSQFTNLNQATGGGAYHLDANGNRVAGASLNYAPDRMWGTALTLIILVLLLNLIARLVGRLNKVAK